MLSGFIVKVPRRGGMLDDYLTLGDNGRVIAKSRDNFRVADRELAVRKR
jgi:hypothetical protein